MAIDADSQITQPGKCPLKWPQQRRNLILFAACTGAQYLAAPVLYVGVTQASLCKLLGASARIANLPSTFFFAMTAVPVLIAWLSPGVKVLKRNLSLCYTTTAVMLAVTAVVLASSLPNSIKIAVVILQGGISGATVPTAIALMWEVIGRGSDESRRGLALAMAFGAGPVLAVVSSVGQMSLLGGPFFGIELPGIGYPQGFVWLFALAVPVAGAAAVMSQFFIVLPPRQEATRAPVGEVAGLLVGLPAMILAVACLQTSTGGIRAIGMGAGIIAAAALVYHCRFVFTRRVLLIATIVTVLVYAGNMIPSNMNLYSPYVLGDSPDKYAGLQNTLRFAFKVLAGTILGWLLTRTNPRFGLLATASLFLAAQLWAIFASGTIYLVAFGLYGAGELVGVYAPDYILSASRPAEMRRNMALVTMLMAPAAPAADLFGAIVDGVAGSAIVSRPQEPEHAGKEKGDAGKKKGIEVQQDDQASQVTGAYPQPLQPTAIEANRAALGFRLSFMVCAGFILTGIILALTMLPPRPNPN